MADEPRAESQAPPDGPAAEAKAARTTRLGALILLGVIVLLFCLYLLGDRFTPYSQQARVHANIVPIAPEISGVVTRQYVTENQLVRKGQPLFTIGDVSFAIAEEKARADLIATARGIQNAAANVTVAQTNLAAAQADELKGLQDVTRLQRLTKEDPGAISVRRLEIARATFAIAQARTAGARASIVAAEANRGSGGEDNDRLRAARATLDRAKLDVTRTTVVAPGDGLITNLKTEAGRYASPSSPVMTFIAVHDVWVSADMTENNLGHVRPGQPVDVVFDVLPGQVFRGRVRSISYGVSAGSPAAPGALPEVQNNRDWLRQAQRFPVRIEFDRATLDKIKGLREGGQAEVLIYTGDRPILNTLGSLYIRLMSLLSYAY